MRRLLLGLICVGLLSIASAQTCIAIPVAFEFTGSVIESNDDPFGHSIPFGSIVTGKFTYDTESQPTHDVGTCIDCGYRQQRVNGFYAEMGGVHVRADDYVIELINNGNGGLTDGLNISFLSNYAPPLVAPLSVATTPQTEGTFLLNFLGFSSVFSNSLPTTLSLASFDFLKQGFFNDTALGSTDVSFFIDTLEPASVDLAPPATNSVPEPGAVVLTGIAVIGMWWLRRDVWRPMRSA